MHTMFVTLVNYPEANYQQALSTALSGLATADPMLAGHISEFQSHLDGKILEDLQELFTSTFDMNPDCTLDLGWHLFGEDQKRGFFLAKVRRELARHDVRETCELPDHLTHALQVLDKMKTGDADSFAISCVIPAIKKILAGLEKQQSLYLPLYKGLLAFLRKRHVPATDGQNPLRGRAQGVDPESTTKCSKDGTLLKGVLPLKGDSHV